ncbi:MAG: hypothetical protein GY793_10125 [Proteobacteria bacterium]|nr:hypothetical protein [Pseudomonadota bacterium]
MYKIQIGFEDGLYVAYLAKHYENELEASVEEEVTADNYYDLIISIPEEWKEMLTSYLYN